MTDKVSVERGLLEDCRKLIGKINPNIETDRVFLALVAALEQTPIVEWTENGRVLTYGNPHASPPLPEGAGLGANETAAGQMPEGASRGANVEQPHTTTATEVATSASAAAPADATPETDKLFDLISDREQPDGGRWGDAPSKWSYEAILDLTDFARKLERERDALARENATLKADMGCAPNCERGGYLRSRLAALQEQCDRLTGMKFSDRMHAALVSRAEAAEKSLAAMQSAMDEAKGELPAKVPSFLYNGLMCITAEEFQKYVNISIAIIAKQKAEIAGMREALRPLAELHLPPAICEANGVIAHFSVDEIRAARKGAQP